MDLVKRYLFWMVMAAVLLVVIVADAVIVGVLQKGNSGLRAGLTKAVSDADSVLSLPPGSIPAKQVIEQYRKYKEEIQAQVEQCLQFYRRMRVGVSRPRPILGTEVDPRTQLPYPDYFKTDYPIAMQELHLRLRASGIRMGPAVWPATQWVDIPTNREIFVAQLEYWLLSDMVDMLVSNRDLEVKRVSEIVIEMDSFVNTLGGEMAPEEEAQVGMASTFATIPFAIAVEIDYRTVPLFLKALEDMDQRRAVHLLTVEISRLTEPQEERLYAPIVELRASCEVLHYIERRGAAVGVGAGPTAASGAVAMAKCLKCGQLIEQCICPTGPTLVLDN